MAKGVKVTLPNQSHDDDDESSLRNKMIKEFGINGYNIITKLMEKLEKRKMTLESQEDLLILEKERNLELQKSIDDKDEEIEKLTRKLLLVNSTMEEKEVELSKATSSIVDLKNANELLQSNISSLKVRYQELEVKFDTPWKSTSSTSSSKIDSNFSTSKGCKRCYNHDMNACAANLDKIGVLEDKIKWYNNMIKEEMLLNKDGSIKVETKYKPIRDNQEKKRAWSQP